MTDWRIVGENEGQLEESQQEQETEIGLKQAVEIALQEVSDLYSVQGIQLTDLLLEEVDRTGDTWRVTVGFTRPGSFAALGGIGSPRRRAFKQVRIDAETGEFRNMQIRTLPDPQ